MPTDAASLSVCLLALLPCCCHVACSAAVLLPADSIARFEKIAGMLYSSNGGKESGCGCLYDSKTLLLLYSNGSSSENVGIIERERERERAVTVQ